MKSIGYPRMFETTSSTSIVEDNRATLNNLELLLGSEKGEMFGDPFFGTRVRRYLFDQNNRVLKDIIIDEIYTQIKIFMPQVTCKRNDIDIVVDRKDKRGIMTANIKVINNIDFSQEFISLVLFQGEV